ncbi:hypothetical protein [Streptomyces xiaopingdaonensis]|uniref:hypothetical protein n=1 Tax=Streptomyces xiaopingdaonensis TaxID=1565415 RepID=UPI00138AAF67|nr:hypothetical protein [Streptomyces xiaopingdaonensis]
MASIVERPRKGGKSTFQVKWRQDGSGWQSEKFGDRPRAEQFKSLVDAHGPPANARLTDRTTAMCGCFADR